MSLKSITPSLLFIINSKQIKMAASSILTSLLVNGQLPLDDKAYKVTLSSLTNLGTGDSKAFTYYEGMLVYCNEDKVTYQWREVKEEEPVAGLIGGGYTYPSGSVSNGITYSGRKFNFFPANDRVKHDEFETLLLAAMGVKKIVPITQADYDALPTPRDPEILYLTPCVTP
jgi:hypothetical protein